MDISIPDEKELKNLFKSKKQYNKNTIKSLYEYKKYTTEFADEIKDFDKFYLDSFIISINNDKNYVLIVKCIKSIDETKKYLVRFLDYNSEILYNAQQSPSEYYIISNPRFNYYNLTKYNNNLICIKTGELNTVDPIKTNITKTMIINNNIILFDSNRVTSREDIGETKTETKTKSKLEKTIEKRLVKQKDSWKTMTGGNKHIVSNNIEIITDYDSNKLTKINFDGAKLKYYLVYSDRGWSNSYNSIYHKKQYSDSLIDFEIEVENTSTVSSMPVSWIHKDYMYNQDFNTSGVAIKTWNLANNKKDNNAFKHMCVWKFEEVPILNRDYSENIIMSNLKTERTTLTNNINKDDPHSLKSETYFIQNKLFLQSSLLYSDFNYKELKISDIIFTLYSIKDISDQETMFTDYINDKSINQEILLEKLKTNQYLDILISLYIYYYIIYFKSNKMNIVITNNNYVNINNDNNSNQWKFIPVKDKPEHYNIVSSNNTPLFINKSNIFELIRQSGNNDGYYLIKEYSSKKYLYTYQISNMPYMVGLDFEDIDNLSNVSNKYLFNIKDSFSKLSYEIPNTILRKDLYNDNYSISPFSNVNKYLSIRMDQGRKKYRLIDFEKHFSVSRLSKLNSKLKSVYNLKILDLQDKIILEYVPLFSNKYDTFIIKNNDKSSPNYNKILLLNDRIGDLDIIWTQFNQNDILSKSYDEIVKYLWIFKQKTTQLESGDVNTLNIFGGNISKKNNLLTISNCFIAIIVILIFIKCLT